MWASTVCSLVAAKSWAAVKWFWPSSMTYFHIDFKTATKAPPCWHPLALHSGPTFRWQWKTIHLQKGMYVKSLTVLDCTHIHLAYITIYIYMIWYYTQYVFMHMQCNMPYKHAYNLAVIEHGFPLPSNLSQSMNKSSGGPSGKKSELRLPEGFFGRIMLASRRFASWGDLGF